MSVYKCSAFIAGHRQWRHCSYIGALAKQTDCIWSQMLRAHGSIVFKGMHVDIVVFTHHEAEGSPIHVARAPVQIWGHAKCLVQEALMPVLIPVHISGPFVGPKPILGPLNRHYPHKNLLGVRCRSGSSSSSCTLNETPRTWNVRDRQSTKRFTAEGSQLGVMFTPTGRLAVAGAQSSV